MVSSFLIWTEVDPNTNLSQTASRATWTDMLSDEECYLYLAEALAGDFTHLFAFRVTAIDTNTDGNDPLIAGLWGVFDNFGRMGHAEVGANVTLWVQENGVSTTDFTLYLTHKDDSEQDTSIVLDVGTTYYVKLTRVGDVFTAIIYSDAGRTTDLDTITIDLSLEDEAGLTFNYIQVTGGLFGNWKPNEVSDGYVENFYLTGTTTSGDYLSNSGGDVNDMHIIDWVEEQSWDVAVRDVPLRTAGSKVDTGHKVINPKVITIMIRLSTAQKTTLQALIDANEITTFATEDGVWSYEVWIANRNPRWRYKKVIGTDDVATEQIWETTLKLIVQSGGKV